MKYMCMQVKVPELQARCGHSAATFTVTPTLTLVTIFGGDDDSFSLCANTTVLELGESTCMM